MMGTQCKLRAAEREENDSERVQISQNELIEERKFGGGLG